MDLFDWHIQLAMGGWEGGREGRRERGRNPGFSSLYLTPQTKISWNSRGREGSGTIQVGSHRLTVLAFRHGQP